MGVWARMNTNMFAVVIVFVVVKIIDFDILRDAQDAAFGGSVEFVPCARNFRRG